MIVRDPYHLLETHEIIFKQPQSEKSITIADD